MTKKEELLNELEENKEILADCIKEKNLRDIQIQQRVIRQIEREIEELELPEECDMDYTTLCISQGLARYC